MKGKFIKKLTAYALTAAMIVSTPMTAFASEFADNFWVSDGEAEGTETGTVSTTETNTTVLKDNAANILGIKVSPASVVMKQYETKKLTAEVLYADDKATTDDDKKEIITQIKWRTSNNAIVTVDAKKGSMNVCPINAKNNGFATVTAELDLDNDGVGDFIASVKVMVKRDVQTVEWNIPSDAHFYAGHTYDLHDYVLVNGTASDASDEIAFAISADLKKQAAINGDGILTVMKNLKTEAEVDVTVTARGVTPATTKIKLELGSPVKKMKATALANKGTIDIADAYDEGTLKETKPEKRILKAEVTVEGKNGPTTDDFTWVSSNEKVVAVRNAETSDADKDGKTDNKIAAEFVGKSVGKAKVTVTATSGKKATFNVTVKASLIAIEQVSLADNSTMTWTGKTTPVTIKRVPAENTDKLKLEVTASDKKIASLVKVKNYNIVPAVDLKEGRSEIQVVLGVKSVNVKRNGNNKTVALPEAGKATITVKQSDVELKGVARSLSAQNDGIAMNYKVAERLNPSNRVVTYYPILGKCVNPADLEEAAKTISWESSKETVATIDNGKLKVVGEGTAKITVSGVAKDPKGKFKVGKFTFNVKSTPKCEEIVLKSNTATVVGAGKATISVKQQLPKKAADALTWYVDGEKAPASRAKDFTDKKAVVTKADDKNNDGVIELLATTGSVSVEAKVYVVSAKVKKVEGTLGSATLSVGGMTTISATKADNNEPIVRYEVDKNGASVVKVIEMTGMDGSKSGAMVIAIGKGKATISAVSASGKSAKFKITVD